MDNVEFTIQTEQCLDCLAEELSCFFPLLCDGTDVKNSRKLVYVCMHVGK